MIDPSIIINGSRYADQIQARNSEGLQNLIGVIGQIGYDSKLRKMRQLGNQQDRQAFANNSIFTNKLNTQLTADNAAEAKAANDQLVFNANLAKTYGEIGKTGAETGKLGAETGKITTDTGIARQNNTGSIWSAFLTGGVPAAKAQLENAKANGVINEAAYQYESNAINNLATMPNAAEQQQYAMGRFKGLQDPKYIIPDENAVLSSETSIGNNKRDNATSEANSQRTYNASIYGTNKDYELGQQELQVKQKLEQQKINIEQNQGEIVAGSDGMGYIFYKNRPVGNRYEPLLGQDGNPAKAPAATSNKGGMSATAQKELFEVGDSISAANNGIANLRDALKYSAKAYDGAGASQRATFVGNFKDSEEATATTMLNNIVTGNALEMLKATFGGAPTEGERAILLQLQGSANLPRAQRDAIYTRAIKMADRRLKSNQAKAEGIRSGSYFQSQQGGGTGGATLSYLP